jgi:hypothetical protein
MPNVICVYDANALQKYTVKDFIESDVVICPVDLLEAKKGQYMRCLAQAATGSSKEMEAPSLPSETGQIEKNGASGVWIPRKFVRFQ